MALQCGGKIEFGRHHRAAICSLSERATSSEHRKQQMFRPRDPFDGDATGVRWASEHQQRVAPFVEIDAFVAAA